MKKISILFCAMMALSLFSFQSVNGQKILSGDLKFLKGQGSINVVFDFSGLKIEKEIESEFLAREADERNKKEAGSGDKMKENWEKDKTERFVAGFVKILKEDLGIPVEDANAKYTLVVYNINLTNKGWGNKFSGGNPASMEVDFKFVETGNQNSALCELREEHARYMATGGTISQKIQGCLEYAAHQLVKSMKKNM